MEKFGLFPAWKSLEKFFVSMENENNFPEKMFGHAS